MLKLSAFLLLLAFPSFAQQSSSSWIRINLLGYGNESVKAAVWVSKTDKELKEFELVDAVTNQIVYTNKAGKHFGAYGPFSNAYRLIFTGFSKTGHYFLRAGDAHSPVFSIGENVYKGAADFSLKYMRQQRSGYNPYLKDSCHTHDAYTMDGPMPDSTHLNVSGGWHDATDYLQYTTTSAHAAWNLLAAYRDFSPVFTDQHGANGLDGSNGVADVLDEARWGLDWLLKMHPRPDWMFNQLADDRDHKGFRLPNKDAASYGKGLERPVYFLTGEIQGLGKYKNRTKGTSSTAGKFSSAFALGYKVFADKDKGYAATLKEKSLTAWAYALKKPGNTQTACLVSPYFYEEDNWVDDMELAAAELYTESKDPAFLDASFDYALKEKITPWIGKDTAGHYQYYPFINPGHYELARAASGEARRQAIAFYKAGIELVAQKAYRNAFYRGVPFVWCSNNLQAAFAIQCYWYRQLSGDTSYAELEQSCFDWLLGCNPWGTSMVVGLPADGDFPDDPHSSFNVLNGYQTLGALVDGPVYGTIYRKQLGVTIAKGDEYAEFQSKYVVYHDDAGDYATNEPTMDGTSSLIYLLAAKESETSNLKPRQTVVKGAIVRGDETKKKIALVFTGDSFADGAQKISEVLKREHVKASFFFTGNFYRNPQFAPVIRKLRKDHHYLGAHSDKHLLYCSWTNRDSLLVTRADFQNDLKANYSAMKKFGIKKEEAPFFLPPYEWYNDSIAAWTRGMDLQLINYSPGTQSTADYTLPNERNYRSSDVIMESIKDMSDLSGFILLLHIGTDPKRTDKMYDRLPELIAFLKERNYEMVTVEDNRIER